MLFEKESRTRRRGAVMFALLAVFFTVAVSSLDAQTLAGDNDREINAAIQGAIIDSVSKALLDNYIFLDKAEAMVKSVRSKYTSGGYKEIKLLSEFARQLVTDLRAVSNDKHISMGHVSEQMLHDMQAQGDTTAPDPFLQEMIESNMGFKKLEILDGNVGYLDLRGFCPAEVGGETAIAAMNFLSGCDAVIFDLRQNGGGDPSMIQLLSSYLFEHPVHLNSFYIRSLDTMQQFWTQAYVPGKKLPQADVFVLTSPYTFSGAEEFSYNLKNTKRGTIIGKSTGGGAHPTAPHMFANLNIVVNIPYGRAINPISGTNWEGVGVAPDVDVDPEQALPVAHMMAMDAIASRTVDIRKKERLQWASEALSAEVKPMTLDPSMLAEYVGTYGPRRVWLDDGKLLYQRGENPPATLIPLAKDRFMLKGVGYFRAQFERGESGRVTAFVGKYDNGTSDRHERTE